MARNRIKTGSLTRQIKVELEKKLAIGVSKHQEKRKNENRQSDKIHSWATYKTYQKWANRFANDCKEKYGCKTLDECREHVKTWIIEQKEQGISPCTQKMCVSALAKLYGCSGKDFNVKTDVRHRADITRSRGEKERDKHFSEKNHDDLVSFARSTGLRRAELTALTGDKLIKEDGIYKIKVNAGSKGGRPRNTPIIGTQKEIERVVERMRAVGIEKVFERVTLAADIHSYRADYATKYYKQIARDIKDIPFDKVNKGTGREYQSEVYSCREDMKGIKFDKVAMLEVSKALGHNRISVIAGHYLRDVQEVIEEIEEVE